MLSNLKLCTVWLALAIITAGNAMANGKPADPPPAAPPVSTSTSNAGAAAGANAGASARQGQQQGQGQGQRQKSTSGANITDSSGGDSFRSSMWVLPGPVWTPPMPRPEVPDLCPAPTETQGALSVGAGVIFSKAESLRDNDPCTAIKYSALLWDRCQYKSSARILDVGMKLFAKKAGEPWQVADRADLLNYSVAACTALTSPPPMVAPPKYETFYIPPAPPAVKAPAQKPTPKKKHRYHCQPQNAAANCTAIRSYPLIDTLRSKQPT